MQKILSKTSKCVVIPLCLMIGSHTSYGTLMKSPIHDYSLISYDFDRAVVHSTITSKSPDDYPKGEILKLGNVARFVGIVPGFKLSLNESAPEVLSDRSEFQLSVPFYLNQGNFPSKVKVSSGLFIEKEPGSKIVVSSHIRFDGFALGAQHRFFELGSRLNGAIPLETELDLANFPAARKQLLCNQGLNGHLTILFSVAAERKNKSSTVSVFPSAGPSLVVLVESKGNTECPGVGTNLYLK